MKVPIISFVAAQSNTGKTTFLEKLIKELVERGYKIGTIKSDAHGFEIDKPGKDSWRHAQAGAKATAIISKEKFAVIHTTDTKKDLDKVASIFEDVDIILVEGFKDGDKPKIEIVREVRGSHICSPLNDLIAVVTDVKNLELDVPRFDINDAPSVAEFIIKKYLLEDEQIISGKHLSHFDHQGHAIMVDVTEKTSTTREAVARGEVLMDRETLALVEQGKMAKGDVLGVARIAGIMGVKETSRLIPMCHPLLIGSVKIDFSIDHLGNKVEIECRVKITGQTGVEMEALTGVNIAALTIYDMCKAVDKDMVISNIRLIKKTGGKSGTYEREVKNG